MRDHATVYHDNPTEYEGILVTQNEVRIYEQEQTERQREKRQQQLKSKNQKVTI